MRQTHNRKSYERMVLFWEHAQHSPLTAPIAADLGQMTRSGAHNVLRKMEEEGTMIGRAMGREPKRYTATDKAPPEPPPILVDTSLKKKKAEHQAALARTQEKFSAFPAWMCRIPKELRE